MELGRTDRVQNLPEEWDDDCPGYDVVPLFEPRPNTPVPWGCEVFNLNLSVTPCVFIGNIGNEDCERVEITKEIEICCSCDARQPQDEI